MSNINNNKARNSSIGLDIKNNNQPYNQKDNKLPNNSNQHANQLLEKQRRGSSLTINQNQSSPLQQSPNQYINGINNQNTFSSQNEQINNLTFNNQFLSVSKQPTITSPFTQKQVPQIIAVQSLSQVQGKREGNQKPNIQKNQSQNQLNKLLNGNEQQQNQKIPKQPIIENKLLDKRSAKQLQVITVDQFSPVIQKYRDHQFNGKYNEKTQSPRSPGLTSSKLSQSRVKLSPIRIQTSHTDKFSHHLTTKSTISKNRIRYDDVIRIDIPYNTSKSSSKQFQFQKMLSNKNTNLNQSVKINDSFYINVPGFYASPLDSHRKLESQKLDVLSKVRLQDQMQMQATSQIVEERQKLKVLENGMPLIKVSSKDPDNQHLRRVFGLIKAQNQLQNEKDSSNNIYNPNQTHFRSQSNAQNNYNNKLQNNSNNSTTIGFSKTMTSFRKGNQSVNHKSLNEIESSQDKLKQIDAQEYIKMLERFDKQQKDQFERRTTFQNSRKSVDKQSGGGEAQLSSRNQDESIQQFGDGMSFREEEKEKVKEDFKEIQMKLQRQIFQFKNLKDVNDKLFYTPLNLQINDPKSTSLFSPKTSNPNEPHLSDQKNNNPHRQTSISFFKQRAFSEVVDETDSSKLNKQTKYSTFYGQQFSQDKLREFFPTKDHQTQKLLAVFNQRKIQNMKESQLKTQQNSNNQNTNQNTNNNANSNQSSALIKQNQTQMSTQISPMSPKSNIFLQTEYQNLNKTDIANAMNATNLFSQQSKTNKSSLDQRQLDFLNKSQRVKCLNDQFKLVYDKDSFLRFYKFKQSLESQNILFNQLQERQKISKLKTSDTEAVNMRDFFVTVKQIDSYLHVKYISLGCAIACKNEKLFVLGGKNASFFQRGYTLAQYQDNSKQLEFEQVQDHNLEKQLLYNDIYNRYDPQIHIYRDKLLIIGGESGTMKSNKNKMRTVLGDMIIFNPQTFEKNFVHFQKPLNKIRATCSCIVVKYLYLYGGIQESGEISNQLIRINLTRGNSNGAGNLSQRSGSPRRKNKQFKWKVIQVSIKPQDEEQKKLLSQGLLKFPGRAYSQIQSIYYQQKLEPYKDQNLDRFKMQNLKGGIDWSQADTYLEREGLFVFGGINERSIPTNDLFIIKVDNQGKHFFFQPETQGKTPTARYMHSMNYYKKSNVLIIFGGRNDTLKTQNILADMHVLYLDSLTWQEVTFCNQKLQPRFNFCTAIIEHYTPTNFQNQNQYQRDAKRVSSIINVSPTSLKKNAAAISQTQNSSQQQYTSTAKLIIMGGQNQEYKIMHDYEIVELDQEANFQTHASQYFFKKMGAFIRANFAKNKEITPKESPSKNQSIFQWDQSYNVDSFFTNNILESGRTAYDQYMSGHRTKEAIFRNIMRMSTTQIRDKFNNEVSSPFSHQNTAIIPLKSSVLQNQSSNISERKDKEDILTKQVTNQNLDTNGGMDKSKLRIQHFEKALTYHGRFIDRKVKEVLKQNEQEKILETYSHEESQSESSLNSINPKNPPIEKLLSHSPKNKLNLNLDLQKQISLQKIKDSPDKSVKHSNALSVTRKNQRQVKEEFFQRPSSQVSAQQRTNISPIKKPKLN